MQNNKLTKIDGDLFKNNPNLEKIRLFFNHLQEFSFSAEMPVMTKLREIDLLNNWLTDLDVVTLLEKCPNLKIFDLSENKFSCERQQQIIAALNVTNVYFGLDDCVM